jgi:hypothetical protein
LGKVRRVDQQQTSGRAYGCGEQDEQSEQDEPDERSPANFYRQQGTDFEVSECQHFNVNAGGRFQGFRVSRGGSV